MALEKGDPVVRGSYSTGPQPVNRSAFCRDCSATVEHDGHQLRVIHEPTCPLVSRR